MKKRKLLITAPRVSGHGGTETVIQSWLNSKLVEQFDIILFVARMHNDDWLNNIDSSIEIINGGHDKVQRILTYFSLLKTHSIDIIVDTNTKTLKMDYRIRKLLRKSYTIFSWLHFSLHHVQSINTDYLKYADCHLAISSGIANQLNEVTPNTPIHLIYNPIQRQEMVVREETDIIHFVYIGRMEWKHQKNLSLLFQAFQSISKECYQLHLYGDGQDMEWCQQKAKEMGINATFYGWAINPWVEMSHPIHYVVLSSNFEGFPMVIGEALARGIPVISTDCPTGPRDMIVNQMNGYLYPVGNLEQLNMILQICLDKRKKWNGNEIQQSIQSLYSEQYFDRLIEILERR